MFGNIGPEEIILILVVLLVVFGPGRIPELGGALGKGIRQFKRSVRGEEDTAPPQQAQAPSVAPPQQAVAISPPPPAAPPAPSQPAPEARASASADDAGAHAEQAGGGA